MKLRRTVFWFVQNPKSFSWYAVDGFAQSDAVVEVDGNNG